MRALATFAGVVLALSPALASAQTTTPAPADPAAPAVPAAVPPPVGIELRLPDPGWYPARTPSSVTGLSTPAQVIEPLLPQTGAARSEAESRLARGQVVGGAQQTYDLPGQPTLRAWAVQFASPGGARGGAEAMRWALRVRADTSTQTVIELPSPAGARLIVTADRAGGTRTTAIIAMGTWAYGVESQAAAGQSPEPTVAALIGRVMERQPDRFDPAGAQPVGVDDALRAALGTAYAATLRRGAAVRPPVAGTTQAATYQGTDWALARFSGVSSDPVLFRRPAGGSAWTVVGDVGGQGCPRIPAPVKEVWGLSSACPLSASPVSRPDDPDALTGDDSPFRGLGTWVWELKRPGDAASVVTQATTFGLRTVFVKSGDGVRYWKQFDRSIGTFRAAGLKVCAWQYIYGRRPVAEARVAARAVRAGADCFVVDAESEFEGPRGSYGGRTYRAARLYMAELRRLVGPDYPIALTSFAYVDYHPRFPYSAFIEGPNGVDVNMPQIYWGAFRQSVDRAVNRTARWNSIYGVPIAPIAGTYEREVPSDLRRFRCLSAAIGWPGASYWSFQETRASQWPAMGRPVSCTDATLVRTYPTLRIKSHGDAVVWLQTRLRAWGSPVARTGFFRGQTRAAVRAFQRSHGLQADGVAGSVTWSLLLGNPPPRAASRGR
ncbi:MAG: peptidoglycan-binding protein [Thermoleophilia bacterium]|nr:peptidoglycan-binding protein [Thermoleophilia bacterium]